MYVLDFHPAFVRDLKHYKRRRGDMNRVRGILKLLQAGQPLPQGLRDHQLQGKMRPYRELHVEGDWLLVYEKDGKEFRILCLWLVSHKKLRERERVV
ncbi:MAG: type II toxin-antitoxin system YafQ family toxin [Candidatus Peregrinibacteria bacterium]|nr:type II toxin-antitoxin system YafQ family toxin [Candidatus Peregrinibacteria bacterium]